MKNILKTCFVLGLTGLSHISSAQFAAIVGQTGTTAMYKDSSAFVDWASACTVVRGHQDISSPGPYADVGDQSMALGQAGSNAVVSLGDGGYAILQFSSPIADAQGPDFAVFENSFNDVFLELAFVEVSSDGTNFFRFPAISNTDTTTQTGSFGSTDATKINNLAGKYRALYGTPFDLLDIADHPLLNKQAITHVKIIDVVGCIQNQYCTRDASNHKVNDPWPTAFGSGGFDLDAVGVIHNQNNVGMKEMSLEHVSVFPNPANETICVNISTGEKFTFTINNLIGEELISSENNYHSVKIDVTELIEGVYTIIIKQRDKTKTLKFIKTN